jgi:hypothetical protein
MHKIYNSKRTAQKLRAASSLLFLISILTGSGIPKAIAQPTYCSTGLHVTNCSTIDNINTVAISGTSLSNSNSGCAALTGPGYSDYPAFAPYTATLQKGQTYTLTVNSSASSIISVWIDYNQNGFFESSEWNQVATSTISNLDYSISITIPGFAASGLTGMRVRSRAAGNSNFDTDACTQFGSGETEDYVVNITGSTGSGTSNYCTTGLHAVGCSSIDNIDSFSINGTSLNNAATGCASLSGPAFSIYPVSPFTTATLQRGLTYAFNVTSTANSIISIWIDYDQDDNYESSEWTQVTTSSIANATHSVNITIPGFALNGTTGLRIRSRLAGNPNFDTDACTQFGSGETEEYTITISGTSSGGGYCNTGLHGSACTSTDNINSVNIIGTTLSNLNTGCSSASGLAYTAYPASGNTTTSLTIGQNYQLRVAAGTASSDISVWVDYNRNSIFEASEWTQVVAGSSPGTFHTVLLNVPSTALAGTTGMRIRSRAATAGNGANNACTQFFSGETEDYTITLTNTGGTSYCNTLLHVGNCSATDNINSVSISGTTLSNLNTGCTSVNDLAYTVYPPIGNATGTLIKGQTYSLSVTSTDNSIISVWIDYNKNNIFEASEWTQVTTNSSPSVAALVNITVPGSALAGATGMRIRSRLFGNQNGSGDACLQFGSGETEDYTITIANANDVGVTAITSPISGCGLSAASQVCITVHNFGTTAVSNVPVVYRVNGGTPTTGTVAGPIAAGADASFCFATTTNLATAGTYTIVSNTSLAGDGNTGNNLTTVTVNSLAVPAAPTAGNNGPACTGGNLQLTASNITGATYSWSGPGGFTSTLRNPNRTNVTAAMAGAYSVTVTVNGCTSAAATTNVIINNPPAAPIASSNSPVCAGAALTLSTPAVAGAVYAWTGPNGFTSAQRTPSISNATAAAAGVYSVTITLGGCTSAAGTTSVAITPVDNAAFSYPATSFCKSGSNPSPSVGAGVTGNFSATPSGLVFTSASTGQINLAASNAGTYAITFTTNGPCPSTATATVNISNAPNASFTYSGSVFCQSATDPTPFFAPGASAGTFSASPAGLVFVSTATGQVDLSASAAGTYTVTNSIAASGSCAATSATGTLTVNATPIITATNVSACEDSNLQLSVTGLASATYSWTGPNGFTSSQQNPTLSNITLAMSGTYTVTATENACASVPVSITVTVNPAASSVFNYTTSTFCKTGTNPTPTTVAGSNGTFSASPNGLVFTSTATGEINLSASATGTYTVTYSTSGVCGSNSSQQVTITNSPNANFTFNGTSFCQGGASVSPFFASGASAGTFSATPAGLVFANAATGEIDLSTSAAGTYTVTNTIAASGGCGAATANAVIIIGSQPVIGPLNDITVCEGSSATFTLSGSPVASYSWTGPNGFSSNQQNPALGSVTTAMSGVYTVTVSQNGCSSQGSLNLTVNAAPNVIFNALPAAVCEDSGVITLVGQPAGGVFSGPGVSGTTFDPVVAGTGTHNITYSVTSVNGCVGSSTQTIEVRTTPTAGFTAQITAPGNNVTITDNSTGANFYSYDFGDGSAPQTSATPSHQYTALGTFTITQTLTALGGCISTATQTVTITTLAVAADLSSTIKLYPNPTTGVVNLDLSGQLTSGKVTVEVYNVLGELIISRTVSGNSQQMIDLSTHAAGTYTVRIRTADQVLVKQVMLQQ